MKHEHNANKHKVHQMSARYPWLDFHYADPEANFDRSLVHGVTARLFTVKDPKFCVALDTTGGGRVS